MRVRFSLRQLMSFMAFAAIGCGGLARPSVYLASAAFTVTLVILLVAILAAVGRTGTARVFWIGFALAGWGYLWLAHWPDEEYTLRSEWQLQTSGPLFTTKLLRMAHTAMHPVPQQYIPPTSRGAGGLGAGGFFDVPSEPAFGPVFAQPGSRGGNASDPFGSAFAASVAYDQKLAAFMRFGHSLWALVFAYLGGHLTRYFRATAGNSSGKGDA
jgi:hypothetical protein